MTFIKQILSVVATLILMQCSPEKSIKVSINYPEPKPDSVALRFLPDIVCSDSLDLNSAFSIDGKSFFFTRSIERKYKIYVSVFDGKNWTSPTSAPFSDERYSEADPFITPNGNIYYISNRPKDEADTLPDFDIWFVRPLENEKWSAPENIQEINSDSTEYYVSLSANGNIYFASNRQGGYGSHDIYYSKFINGKYLKPVNLGPSINTSEVEHDPLVAGDEQFLIFTSADRPDGYGEGDLYYSEIDSSKAWAVAKNMGKRFNTPTYEYCSYFSPDLKYFFFSSDYDVKWIDAKYLPHVLR